MEHLEKVRLQPLVTFKQQTASLIKKIQGKWIIFSENLIISFTGLPSK